MCSHVSWWMGMREFFSSDPGLGVNPEIPRRAGKPFLGCWKAKKPQFYQEMVWNERTFKVPGSPNLAVIPWNSTPHPWLAALEEFYISSWSWGWDLFFSPSLLLPAGEWIPKRFLSLHNGKETDCTVAPAFILIPANSTLQILECNAKKKIYIKNEKCS